MVQCLIVLTKAMILLAPGAFPQISESFLVVLLPSQGLCFMFSMWRSIVILHCDTHLIEYYVTVSSNKRLARPLLIWHSLSGWSMYVLHYMILQDSYTDVTKTLLAIKSCYWWKHICKCNSQMDVNLTNFNVTCKVFLFHLNHHYWVLLFVKNLLF